MSQYDSIIIGAGHNGLVCAAYLARAGQKVVVVESSDLVGGLAAVREFHPGFSTRIAHSATHFSSTIAADLKLASHGYRPSGTAQTLVGLGDDGNHVIVSDSNVSGVSESDASAYRDYAREMRRFARALQPFWLKTMPRIGNKSVGDLMTFAQMGLGLRRLGRDDMSEFLRIASLPARDLMDERFESDLLKSVLSWDGLIGSKMAPRSPNSAVLAMLYRLSGINVEMATLVSALDAAARSEGAEIVMGNGVSRVRVEATSDGLAARGVTLSNGEVLNADRVISSADPKTTFLKLVGVENLEIEFTNRIRRLRSDGFVAKLHLALDGLPEFTGIDQPDGRLIIAPSMDAIEFAFDDAKYGECSEHPVLEMTIPSIGDPSLAPGGHHVLSAHVMYVPYDHECGGKDQAGSALTETVIDSIVKYAPGIREQILHSELLTPLDIEKDCNVSGGHWHHVEFAMDQLLMMRPTYEAAQYSTPIPGLYLCGAGCHPGGGLTGAAGHNAAHEILK
jgi:phytoene dehydrogenase-like protein